MARQLRAELGGASAEDSDHGAADGDDAVWRDLVERYAASPQARDYAPEPAVEYNVPRAGHIASTGKQRGRARVAYERRPAARNAELVRAASAGDETALRELVARHSGLVWSVARSHRLSHADAGDVVQSTWLKLVQHLGAIKNPEAVAAWLATTARRECLRVIDDSRIEIPLGDDLPEPQDKRAELDEAQLRSERDSLLWQAVSLLGPDDQALVRMLASDPPASYAEISAALDMPIGSIGPTRARCLERLRARCEQLSASGPPLQPAADGCA
jgi:RNA polymerase sigma factor (sigma-70 family)